MHIRRLPDGSALPQPRFWQNPRALLLAAFIGLFGLAIYASLRVYYPAQVASVQAVFSGLDERFWVAVGVGLLAQMIDGALGMAYGLSATTFLLSTGVSPAVASASVHMAEIFTTGFSGLSHWKLGNVDKALFKRLLFPGLVGVVLGAYVVTQLDGKLLKPWISAYLLGMGGYILWRAWHARKVKPEAPSKQVAGLAVVGGFVDSVGGGGWGPVVTSSLIGRGGDPRRTIGSVNAAEFFLSIAGGVSFAFLVGFTAWQVIAGLVVGGLFAAPLAAWVCKHLPSRLLMVLVGLLISALSAFNLLKSLS